MEPTVKLISYTKDPVATIYSIWQASRTNDVILSVDEYKFEDEAQVEGAVYEMEEVFKKVIMDDIPVAENLDFVFLIEGLPIALREQMVRARIGHKFGENFGVDIVMDQAETAFWSQTMRILDMSDFATDENYFLPEDLTHEQETAYRNTMFAIQAGYRAMVKQGLPVEVARNVLPVAVCSRLTWKMNLQSVKRILQKRGCWIAQLGMWKPIITGIVEELANEVHPSFRNLISPPCMKKDAYVGCPFKGDVSGRLHSESGDPGIPCPLHFRHEICSKVRGLSRVQYESGDRIDVHIDNSTDDLIFLMKDGSLNPQLNSMIREYSKLWGRNVWSGEPV